MNSANKLMSHILLLLLTFLCFTSAFSQNAELEFAQVRVSINESAYVDVAPNVPVRIKQGDKVNFKYSILNTGAAADNIPLGNYLMYNERDGATTYHVNNTNTVSENFIFGQWVRFGIGPVQDGNIASGVGTGFGPLTLTDSGSYTFILVVNTNLIYNQSNIDFRVFPSGQANEFSKGAENYYFVDIEVDDCVPDVVELTNRTIQANETVDATAETFSKVNIKVNNGGRLIMRALRRIVFKDNFRVDRGGVLKANIISSVDCNNNKSFNAYKINGASDFKFEFINQTASVDKIDVYPNPVSTNSILNIQSTRSNINAIKIYDINSRILLDYSSINSQKKEIMLTNFTSGIYFIEIISDGNVKTLKKLKVD